MSPGKILNMIAFTPEISHWLNIKHKLAMFHIFNPITVHLKIMLTVAKIFFDIDLLGKERQKKCFVWSGGKIGSVAFDTVLLSTFKFQVKTF